MQTNPKRFTNNNQQRQYKTNPARLTGCTLQKVVVAAVVVIAVVVIPIRKWIIITHQGWNTKDSIHEIDHQHKSGLKKYWFSCKKLVIITHQDWNMWRFQTQITTELTTHWQMQWVEMMSTDEFEKSDECSEHTQQTHTTNMQWTHEPTLSMKNWNKKWTFWIQNKWVLRWRQQHKGNSDDHMTLKSQE